ncbi:hypothetical protein LN42_05840 [Marinitoga sp. 1137]|uniref:hypothetical protein n=1 Tax=Marinitoga sp. 1137 TaxID=1545835 RepID=UPI000950AC40|nr:hypothetical protein [Marinitoga sp. 1137]APT75951.1 hypothetical protein LN42_05840 [Marinitoga sp. 1137]
MKKVTLILVLLSIAFLFVGCVKPIQKEDSEIFQSYLNDWKNITEESSMTLIEKYFYNVDVSSEDWKWAIEEITMWVPIYDWESKKVTGKVENIEITNEKEEAPSDELKKVCPDVSKVITADLSFDLTKAGTTTSKHYNLTRSAYYIKDRWYVGIVYNRTNPDFPDHKDVVVYPDWYVWMYWEKFLGEESE